MAQTVKAEKAIKSGSKANGAAVASQFFKALETQGMTLLRFLNDITTMGTDARKEFRGSLSAHLSAARADIKRLRDGIAEAIKANDTKVQAELTQELAIKNRTFNSAKVRVSEANRFAEACDAGYTGFAVAQGYHQAIALSRMFLDSKGQGSKRGRASKKPEDRIRAACRNVVESGDLDNDGMKELLTALLKECKGWKLDPEKAAKKDEPTPVEVATRHVGPTQRKERRQNKGSKRDMKANGIDLDRRTHDAPAIQQ